MHLKDMTDEQFREYVQKEYPGVELNTVVQIEQADLLRLKAIQAELLEELKRKSEMNESEQ